jgi:hypothetical protein
MNARYITKLGYGMSSEEFDGDVLAAFLQDATHFGRRVRSHYKQDGNTLLYATVDRVLDESDARKR